MKNISLNGEPIELASNIKYIVIDALYINEIRAQIPNLKKDNIFNEIRSLVFPYTDTPFAEYMPEGTVFSIDKIKKVDYDKIDVEDVSIFSTDSGVVIFVNKDLFIDFASHFDYDELVDSPTDLVNVDYWKSIVSDLDLFDTAIVVSPGINTESEFDGSGTYKIK